MAGKDLGNKHSCWKCGTKFYDLRKPAPICPKCGADAREGAANKAPASEKRARAPREVKVEEPELEEGGIEKELEEGLEEEAEDLDEDEA